MPWIASTLNDQFDTQDRGMLVSIINPLHANMSVHVGVGGDGCVCVCVCVGGGGGGGGRPNLTSCACARYHLVSHNHVSRPGNECHRNCALVCDNAIGES